MQRFDRYILSQLMVLFGFFALVLVAVYWVNRAVVLFDRLIADGHSAGVFLEFSALSLPSVIALVLPMAGFAASVYVTNRLSGDSELTVVQATGYSPWRLARPVLIFGLILAGIMSVLTHFLVPMAHAQLKQREREISSSMTARLLREGAFLHPSSGVTFYTRAITETGELRDVLLTDRRSAGREVTYTADRAYLLRDDAGPTMVMLNGLAQTFDIETGRLSTTNFADFSYDIAGLITEDSGGRRRLESVSTGELLSRTEAVSAEVNKSVAKVLEEAHLRFQAAGLCVVAALIGYGALMTGGYSRFGVTRQIVFAILLLVAVKLVESAVTDPVRSNARLWPLVYAPILVGVALALGLLYGAAKPFRRRGRRSAAVAS